jgi:hypothetical protein
MPPKKTSTKRKQTSASKSVKRKREDVEENKPERSDGEDYHF